MSNRQIAEMYVRGRLRDTDAFTQRNPVRQSTMSPFLRCHSDAPPPVESYDAWLSEARSKDPRGKTQITGAKLRRAVTMKRGGQTAADIGRAIGVSGHSVWKWLALLPPELRP